ncbi:hypothetical protein AB4254_09340 [Vibrio breoganii]
MRDKIHEYALENDITVLTADGFDKAIIGILQDGDESKVVYSEEKMIQCLIETGMSYDSAIEYYSFNVASCYVGKNTPLIISTLDDY